MQRVTLNNPEVAPPENPWFSARRNLHIRDMYALFFKTHTFFCTEDTTESSQFDLKNKLLGTTETKGYLLQLKELCHNLFSAGTHHEQHGHHLNWAINGLYYACKKQRANTQMTIFHQNAVPPEQIDPAHATFITGITEEIQKQHKTIQVLLENATTLLRHILIDQTGNDLLLRLLIEEEKMGKNMWDKTTTDLFNEMFPDQPEAGYTQAGKSYFMAQWLEDALNAYEKSLKINKDTSEPRKQTHLIRAMIKDCNEERSQTNAT